MRQPKGDWTDLFRTFRMSLDPRKVWLAFQGVVWSLVFVGLLLAVLAGVFYARGAPFAAEADVWGPISRADLGQAVAATEAFAGSLFRAVSQELPAQLAQAAERGYSPVYAVLESQALVAAAVAGPLILLILLLVWSYFGGAIMRIAAVEYALGERIELASARAYARRKHHLIYGAPLGLVAAIVILAMAPLVGGLIAWNVLVVGLAAAGLIGACVAAGKTRDATRSLPGAVAAGAGVLIVTFLICFLVARSGWRVPYVGELLLGAISPLLFIVGLVMVVLAIWCVAGGMLMSGAVASSDATVFDAWSRAFHYVFTHPWRYLWYLLVLAGYGTVIVAFVWGVRVATEWAVLTPIALGLQGDFDVVYHFMTSGVPVAAEQARTAPRLLAFFLSIDRFLLTLLFLSAVCSFFATAKTVIYFLMRRVADGTPISEVHLEPRDRDFVCPAPADAEEQEEG